MSATDRVAAYLRRRAEANSLSPVIASTSLYPTDPTHLLFVADLEQILETNRILSRQAAEHEEALAATVREAKAQAWDEAKEWAWDGYAHHHPDNPYI